VPVEQSLAFSGDAPFGVSLSGPATEVEGALPSRFVTDAIHPFRVSAGQELLVGAFVLGRRSALPGLRLGAIGLLGCARVRGCKEHDTERCDDQCHRSMTMPH
jgi:hypothetical protein